MALSYIHFFLINQFLLFVLVERRMHWLCEIQLFEKGKRAGTKADNSNEGSCENGILHNHCSDNDEPNSKDNSEIALHCSLLRASTDFFFSASPSHKSTSGSYIFSFLNWTVPFQYIAQLFNFWSLF